MLPRKGMSKHQRQALRAATMALALRRHRSGPSKDSSIRHESEPMRRKYKRREAATFINAARDPLAEREQREASDTRTDAQRWLGDPPPSRSALAQRKQI
jgi:hypothetical protein